MTSDMRHYQTFSILSSTYTHTLQSEPTSWSSLVMLSVSMVGDRFINLGDILGEMFSDWWSVWPSRSGSADEALTPRGIERERRVAVGVKLWGWREF